MASLVFKDKLGARMVLASPPWGRRERGQCVADASRRWNGCPLRGGGGCPCGGLWVGQRTLSRTHGRERMNGAQMGVASGWAGLSVRRVVGFGGRVRGEKNLTLIGLSNRHVRLPLS